MNKGNSNKTLSFGVTYGYGLGEFGYNFFITFLAYYLMVFLTNIAGFTTALAATIYTCTNIIKWVTMPMAGTIIDAKQLKGGKYRPWLIIGAALMVIGGTVCFTKIMEPGVAYAVVYLIFFFICYLGYGLMWVSYRGLMDPMCSTPEDKVSLSTASAAMGALARIFYVFGAVGIVNMVANATGSQATGYSVVGGLFTVIILLCMIAVSAITKKYDNAEKQAVAAQKQAKAKLSGKVILDNIANKPMIVFIISMLFRISVVAIVPTLLVYYVNLYLGDPTIITGYMMATYFIGFIGAMFVQPITNKFGKKPTFIVSTLFSAVCLIAAKFITAKVGFIVIMCVWQFTGIFASALVPAFMADVAEYGMLTKGGAAAGVVYSIGGIVTQLGAFLGGVIASFGMVAVGFDAAAPTAESIQGIANLMTFGSAAVSVVAALVFILYPLTEKYMADLRAANAPKAE